MDGKLPVLETAAGRTGGQEQNLTASLGRKDQPGVEALKKLQGPRSAAPPPKDDPLQPPDLTWQKRLCRLIWVIQVGPDVITRFLIRRRQQAQGGGRCHNQSKKLRDVSALQKREKEKCFLLEIPEGTSPVSTWTLVWFLLSRR